MNLDIRTLFASMTLLVWVNACVITLIWYYAKSMRNIIGYWSLSQILFGIGTGLVVLRNIIPDSLSIVAANIFLVGGQMAIQEGIARYMGRPAYLLKVTVSALFLHVLLMLTFTYAVPSVDFRIIGYSLTASVISIINIRTLYYKCVPLDVPRRFLTVVLCAFILIMFLRGIFTILKGNYADLMDSGIMQAVAVLGIIGVYVSVSLCLFWLIVHKLGSEVQLQATTDSLTKIPNRRGLDDFFETLLSNKKEGNIGVIIIDIDKFKQINDQYGHQAGDRYLVALSCIISDNLGSGDAAFRYGGDEFVVVAQDVEYSSLIEVVEQLREKVGKLAVSWQESYIQTTISVGIAIKDYNIESWDEIIQMADEALYKAKSQGGNRIETYVATQKENVYSQKTSLNK